MSGPKTAIGQKHLTRDTVGHQFCSDWLKGEVVRLFDLNEKLFKQVQEQSAVIEEMRAGLDKIVALEKDTMLGDPADFDHDAEEAYSAGATNAFCEASDMARECLAKFGRETD